ncbi:DUF2782 domain-containing protein [Dokdonella sp.]|uniref:DUF2782 domain-containing protein n=1 Tax=Dokdonella sp. TaxID=2291710 RepID=UPI002D1FBF43|nr:DUF2782 domain-containing protein [Dokdonella sp.]
MNHHAVFCAALLLCFSASAGAAPPDQSAPPPPDINAKDVSTADPVAEPESVTPAMPDTRLVRDRASRLNNRSASEIETSSDSVVERKEGSDTVREYREKGKLRMIRIVPQKGPAQTYLDRNGDGRLDHDPLDGPVAPVYFTIYEWN